MQLETNKIKTTELTLAAFLRSTNLVLAANKVLARLFSNL